MERAESESCLATDLLRIALEPRSGRLMALGKLQVGVWAAHLLDLVLLGLVLDVDGFAVDAGRGESEHPLLAAAQRNLSPGLPRLWARSTWVPRYARPGDRSPGVLDVFCPDVFQPLSTYNQALEWLVDAGVWKRHRFAGGPFFWRRQFTDQAPRDPSARQRSGFDPHRDPAPDRENLRSQTLACLASASTVVSAPGRDIVRLSSVASQPLADSINRVLAAMRETMLHNQLTIGATVTH